MKHCSLDLETMGTIPGSAIVAIGAVQFELDGKYMLGRRFYRTVDLASCIEAGLTVDGDTVMWWLGQSDAARKAITNYGPARDILARALEEFADWYRANEMQFIWATARPSIPCYWRLPTARSTAKHRGDIEMLGIPGQSTMLPIGGRTKNGLDARGCSNRRKIASNTTLCTTR